MSFCRGTCHKSNAVNLFYPANVKHKIQNKNKAFIICL